MSQDFIEAEGPDGTVYEFPQGTTQEQIVGYLRSIQSPPVSKTESFVQGIRDPIDAGAQLLEKVLPESVMTAGNKLNNKLAEYGLTAPISEEGVASDIAKKEAEFKSRRERAGQTGVDWARVGGNVLSPANLALGASAVPLNTAGRVAMGGVQGLLSEPLPETNDFAEQKLRQAALGVVGGGVGELSGRVAGRVISPAASRNPDIQALMDEGVTPGLGHLLGPRATTVERALHITPILGSTMAMAESRTMDDFNRAVANRILRKVGETAPKDVSTGTSLFAKTADVLSDKYGEILPKLKGSIDPQLQSDISTLRTMASSFPKEYEDTFNRILKNDLEDRFTSSGMASGETLKNIESLIGKRARDYSMSPDPDHRQIGAALNEVKSSLRDMLERQNPAHAGDLRNINQAYASLERMAHATKSAGAQKKGGVFSPEEYLAAVKSADSSLRKRNVAKGTAMDQDFAQAAQRVLGKGQSGIGSAYRTAGAIGLGGAYMANPSILAAEIGASIPYSPIGQRLTSQVIGRRPEMLRAPVLRSSVKAATPMVAPAIISPLQQLRDTNPEQIYRSTTE